MDGAFADRFLIGNRAVGRDCPVYIIAEAGVAHFGHEEKARRLVDLAVESGADAVKFQIFDVNALVAPELDTWRRRLGARQLPYDAFARIKAYCVERGIPFLATAHDEPSFEFLVSLDVPAYKIGSGEVGNWPFLKTIARQGKPVILSTGMYEPDEIGEALRMIADQGQRNVALLHCVTQYPTPPSDAALGRIPLLSQQFMTVIGYSDHTRGFHIPLAAVALGAKVIEKHITLDFDVPDAQDWKVSCGPADFPLFVRQLREIEATLEGRAAGPTAAERENKVWATKSLVTTRRIRAGAVVTDSDLTAKRPGTGVSPARLSDVVGKKSLVDLEPDVVLKWEHLE
jgi:N-acetylneuraminate synthase/N,N'-diacetyllegionaminate synthase